MKLHFTILFLASLLLSASATAQLTIYETYNDYKEDKGHKYTGGYTYAGANGSMAFGVFYVSFKNTAKEKVTIKTTEVWGFKYKDQLFRIETGKSFPVAVVSTGTMCLYENGLAYLHMIDGESDTGSAAMGGISYISKDLQQKVYCIFSGTTYQVYRGEVKKFQKAYPGMENVCACILKANDYKIIRDCVVSFNGSKSK